MGLGAAATAEQLRTWRGHPCLAFAVRAAAFLAPVLVSFGASGVAASLVPRPSGALLSISWWAGLLTFSTIVLIATDRLAKRLLPLVALLKLSLVFPDEAPSRFSFALRSGTTRQLQRRVEQFQLEGPAVSGAADLLALIAALNVHDPRTRGHSERVRAFSDLLAEQLGLADDERERLHWAALLHDIGKLAVPTEILNKAGKPTNEEWTILKTHPDEGVKLVVGPIAEWLGEWAFAIGEHHEQFDGSGYPKGLAGHQISTAGRLVAVADVFDVITAARSYKKPMTAQEARLELVRCAGTQFDPEMVRAFLGVSIGSLRKAMGPTTWLLQIASLGRAVQGAQAAAGAAAAGAATLAAGLAVGVIPSPMALADAPPPASRRSQIEVTDLGIAAALGESGSTLVGSPIPPTSNTSVPVDTSTPDGSINGDGEPTNSASTVPDPTTGTSTDTPSATIAASVDDRTAPTSTAAATATTSPEASASTVKPAVTTPSSSVVGSPASSSSVPKGSGPSISLPPMAVPPISVPPIVVPPVALPVVTLPVITVPISTPLGTLPPVSLPPISVPPISLPPVTVPVITLPPVTIPPLTLPPLTIPHLFG